MKNKTLSILAVILILAGIAFVLIHWEKSTQPIVVNTPPPQTATDSWKTFTDSASGVWFKYPQTLSTQYIRAVDWPPAVQVLNESFACTEAGSEIAQAGKTEKLTIGTHTYCVTRESEGAAGSIYTNYAYAFPKNDKTIILTFSLQAVQCANYDDPQKTACENERTSFNIDTTIDTIAQTLEM